MKRNMICIACPIGCRLTAEWREGTEEVSITGNKCPRGEEYGTEEILSPRRVVTATVASSGPRVPVKTGTSLPKALITPLLDELYRLRVELPINRGQTILADFRGSGVDVVATRTFTEETPA